MSKLSTSWWKRLPINLYFFNSFSFIDLWIFLILKAYTVHQLFLWHSLHTKPIQHNYINLLHSFSPLMKTIIRNEAFIIVSHSHITILCLYADMILPALVGVFPPWEVFCEFLHILSIQTHFHTEVLKKEIFPCNCQAVRLFFPSEEN